MTKEEIIERLAKDKYVEEVIRNCTINRTFNKEDLKELAQDIYISLLTKDNDLIVRLYCEDSLRYYISRIVLSQIVSVNSPYYTKYYKWSNNRTTFTNTENNIDNED